MTAVIETEHLVKNYGKSRGLAGLDMTVEAGEVYGFLGPNGAGKSTAIRLMLDVIRPTSGHATVLGLDPRKNGVELRKRIGYLPGDFLVNTRQTGRQLLDHLMALRGGSGEPEATNLAERLELDLTRPIRSLSKGNRQKLGLVQAFMHQPELLILDEPTSGLDPLIQREFHDMVSISKAAGQTIFMSSHVLSEVEAIVERVGIIREGRMVAVERVESLRERSVRKIEVVFDQPVAASDFQHLSAVSDLWVEDATLRCRLAGSADEFIKALAHHPVVSILSEEPDLEEVFFDFYTKEAVSL